MPRIVDVVERAAAARCAAFGHQLWQAALIPQLHRQAYNGLATALQ
jgi:hypothetical protein